MKHEQNIDCGGGYVKLFDCGMAAEDMHGDSPYHIMFGELPYQFLILLILLQYYGSYSSNYTIVVFPILLLRVALLPQWTFYYGRN